MFQEQGEIPCYGVFQRRRYGGHPSHNKNFSDLMLDLGALFDLRQPGLVLLPECRVLLRSDVRCSCLLSRKLRLATHEILRVAVNTPASILEVNHIPFAHSILID